MSFLHRNDIHDRPLELAALALDVDLTAAETAELEAHLNGCPACARRVAALRADARALSRPLTLLPSARVDTAVYAAIAGRRSPQPHRLLLLAATALLLMAMLGAVVIGAAYLRSLEEVPTTDLPVPTQPVAIVSPDSNASPGLIGETWETIPFDAASRGGLMEAVTFNGTDLVGVGKGGCVTDSNGAGDCHAAAWSAAGGEGWVRAADQPGLAVGLGNPESGPEKGIFDVTDGPAGLVAIGYDHDPLPGSCPVAPCTSGPAVWRAPDGRTWERVPVDFGPAVIDTFSEPVAAITAGPDGYIMVGRASALSPAGDTEGHATAWASPDGVTWTRASDSEELTLGGCVESDPTPDCGGMTAVAATPSGFVAVGYRWESGATQSPAAWTSSDGLTWTLMLAGLDFEGELASVAVGPSGVVAGGMACSAQDCYSTSAVLGSDGVWTVSPATGLGMGNLRRLAATSDTYFGLAWSGSALGLIRSDDGLAWQPVEGLPSVPDATGYRAVDIAASSDRVVVAGWAEVTGNDTFRSFSYRSPAAAGSAVPPLESAAPTAPSATRSAPPVVSVSALRWQQVGAIDGATIADIVAFADSYVAFGSDDTSEFGPPMAWFSEDAKSWEAIALSTPILNCPDWGPTGDEMVPDAEVAAGATNGRQVMLVGEVQARDASACSGGVVYRGLTWISSDGRTWQRSDAFGASTRALDVWALDDGWRTIDKGHGVWRSADGLVWSDGGSAPRGEFAVQATAVAPDGTWLVSGTLPGPTEDAPRVVLMTSSDGDAWAEIALAQGCEQGARSILPPSAADGDVWVLVAAGTASTCVSADLDSWHQGAVPRASPDLAINDVVPTRYGLHAYATIDCVGCPFEDHQYLSRDGTDWTVLDDRASVWPIADGPAGVIGFGVGESGSKVWRLVEDSASP